MTEDIYFFDQTLFFSKIGYTPHSKQWLFHNSTKRFRLLVCGRRWGKTKSAANECLKHLINNNDKLLSYLSLSISILQSFLPALELHIYFCNISISVF